MEIDKSVGVLLGGLGLCGAACLLAPPAAGALTLAAVAGGALAGIGQALAPNIAADLFSRLADWAKEKFRDTAGIAKNHDLRELLIMSIESVLDEVISTGPGGRPGVKLLKQCRARARNRQATVAIDERFTATWEQTIPQYFKSDLHDFSTVTALNPELWMEFLNEGPVNSLRADERVALEAAANALHQNLPKHLVGVYRDALQYHPTVFVAVQTAILQEIWSEVSRNDLQLDSLNRSSATLTDIRRVGEAIVAHNQAAMQDLATEFSATAEGLRVLHWRIEFLSRDTLRLLTETHADVKELLRRQEEDHLVSLRILAEVKARNAAGISSELSAIDQQALREALTSRDPQRRRAAYLTSGNVYMARATHELVKELRLLRPALDSFQKASDEFTDALFEGNLLWSEGKREESIEFYERAHTLRPSDGFAAVALANAVLDLALTAAPDGGDWNPGEDTWTTWVHRSQTIIVPFLEAGYQASNPAFLSAVWAHAHLWYHYAISGGVDALKKARNNTIVEALLWKADDCVEGDLARVRPFGEDWRLNDETFRQGGLHAVAAEISTNSLVRADMASPNHPVTLRLLGRNISEFARDKKVAERYFKRAIEADPGDIRQRFYYALYLSSLTGRDGGAAAVFEECLDIDPDDPQTLEAFAFLLSREPINIDRAELMWKHALRIAPKHPVGWQRYGNFLASLQDAAARAEEVYKKGLANRPNDAELWARYAILLERQPGREADAIAAYDKVGVLHPGWIDAGIRSWMHKIVAGAVANPERIGLWLLNEGETRRDRKLFIAGAWLGLLYAKPDEQIQALKLIKSASEYFGEAMRFLHQPRNIAQAVAAEHQFADWLESILKVVCGESPLSLLEGWTVWESL